MHFESDSFYHVYNRGNDKQLIFFETRNYDFFLKKLKYGLDGICSIIAYCLMPNHFHLMIYIPAGSIGLELMPNQNQQALARKLGTVLSSYSQAINKQEKSTGSLFQQKTKAKLLESSSYAATCFHYIHQNPLKAGLVNKMDEWPYSSFREYFTGNKIFCDLSLANQLLAIPSDRELFYKESNLVIESSLVNRIQENQGF